MNILIASGTYPPEVGGMATFVRRLAKLFYGENIGVAVVAYGEEDRVFNDPFPVQIVSRNRIFLARYWQYGMALKSLIADTDIIYAQDLVSSGLPAAVVSRLTGKQLVLRLGGDFLWEKMVQAGRTELPLVAYYQQSKNFKERLFLAVYRFVLGAAVKIIFNTTYQAGLYQRLFPRQVTSEKITVIENPWQPAARHKSPGSSGDFVYVGRFIRLKNLPRLIRAFAKVPTDKKLRLIGDGPQREELEGLVKRERFERVKIMPPIDREQVLDILARSYALIVPSLTELNPNAVLEALSVGTPVLITAENGLPEAIKNRLELFNPLDEDKLAREIVWLVDAQNYAAYVKKLQEIRFDQTWDKVVGEHHKIFKQLA